MPSPNPQTYHLSASSIASFKQCPTRFRLGYREGLRLIEDTDSLRVGTNWHKLHEVYANCRLDEQEVALEAVVTELNEAYKRCPPSKTPNEWAIEREILLQSFLGYLWRWQDDPIEYLAAEVPFNLPLHHPKNGMPLSMDEVQRVGKIDNIVRWQGGVCNLERKSTSKGIDADSDYWEKLDKDVQVSMYALAFRDMDKVPFLINARERYGNTLYDVWQKPKISPKMLTQADSKQFIADGKYCGQEFKVETAADGDIYIGGDQPELEEGKKAGTFAIRETVSMFGARLLQDIQARPDFYFARREVSRTDKQLRHFREELYAIYQAQKAFEKGDLWYENADACRATFKCPYIPICYGSGSKAVCDGKTTPDNFKRIFVDLTINKQSLTTED